MAMEHRIDGEIFKNDKNKNKNKNDKVRLPHLERGGGLDGDGARGMHCPARGQWRTSGRGVWW